MFQIVQLSHDILTNRVLVGIQGPTPSDFISVNCALPDGPGQPGQAVRSVAAAEAARLLAGAAQALLGKELADPAPEERRAGSRSRFMCACCGDIDALAASAADAVPPAAAPAVGA